MSFVCVSASTKSSMSQGWEFIKEKKKVRKQENTHSFKKKELVQEDKNSVKKTRSRPRNRPRKKESFSLFLDRFLGRFLGRDRLFLVEIVFSWASSFFLERVRVFLSSFINSRPRPFLPFTSNQPGFDIAKLADFLRIYVKSAQLIIHTFIVNISEK